MCEECAVLTDHIRHFRAFLNQGLDPETHQKISDAIDTMLKRKAGLHAGRRPACPKCEMRMIVSLSRPGQMRAFECLRCGHIEACEIAN